MSKGLTFVLALNLVISVCSKGQTPPFQQALWIGDTLDQEYRPASLFRKVFAVPHTEQKHTIRIASLGIHYIQVNGKSIPGQLLNPLFTNFEKRLFYNDYDITNLVKQGDNVITVILGNGFYNHQPKTAWRFDTASWRDRPYFLLEIKDGSQNPIVATDTTWKYTDSPFTFNSIYLGENYDQRLVLENVHSASFDPINWAQTEVKPSPGCELQPQDELSISIVDTVAISQVNEISSKIKVLSLEKNIAGVATVSLFGRKGQKVYIKYGEQLNARGRVDVSNLTHHYLEPHPDELFQTDVLTLDGRDTLTFTQRFSYRGFQHIEFSSNRPFHVVADQTYAMSISSIPHQISEFYCDSEPINSIWEASNNSIQSNMVGYPTDCPTREKNGWTGDGHLIFEAAASSFDVKGIYSKWLLDHVDAQDSNGTMPLIIPSPGWGYENTKFDWTYSTISVPWHLYLYYGDEQLLRTHYPMMRSFIEYWISVSAVHKGLIYSGVGDWKAPGGKAQVALTSTLLFIDALRKTAQVASVLGKERDLARYHQLGEVAGATADSVFYNQDNTTYGNGLQTEMSYALHFGLPQDEIRQDVADALSQTVLANGDHIATGILGTQMIFSTLCDYGYCDQALTMLTKEESPSFINWISGGARTLFEGWDYEPGHRFGGSQNHMFFGTVNAWIAQQIGGIRPSFGLPGFQEIVFAPKVFTHIKESHYQIQTPLGLASLDRNTDPNGDLVLSIVVPTGAVGKLEIPDKYFISEINVPLDQVRPLGPSTIKLKSSSYRVKMTIEASRDILWPNQEKQANIGFDGHKIHYRRTTSDTETGTFKIHGINGKLALTKELFLVSEHQDVFDAEELSQLDAGVYVCTFEREGFTPQSIKFYIR